MAAMKNPSVSDLLELSAAERIQLAFDLWDSVSEVPEAIELTKEQIKELEERLEAFHENPEEASPWSVVKTRVWVNS